MFVNPYNRIEPSRDVSTEEKEYERSKSEIKFKPDLSLTRNPHTNKSLQRMNIKLEDFK